MHEIESSVDARWYVRRGTCYHVLYEKGRWGERGKGAEGAGAEIDTMIRDTIGRCR